MSSGFGPAALPDHHRFARCQLLEEMEKSSPMTDAIDVHADKRSLWIVAHPQGFDASGLVRIDNDGINRALGCGNPPVWFSSSTNPPLIARSE
jgi:hypothetical protein